ncbi:cytochrome P450 4A11-like isoform X2 [Tachyglossus aculeatus]|uniref:cytochrome P450 4A11-like isoform X2 n=1 Tax=Tachyglossus aculeatus TaxID=9261 RepID=UPI0018F43EA0|nr:cytochrome P450 4A11-like isoform X2 [Tachyglossus aculeatus]
MVSRLDGGLDKGFSSLPALLLLALALALIKGIQLFLQRQKLLKTFAQFPGPPPHWLLGHLHQNELSQFTSWIKSFPFGIPLWNGSFGVTFIVYHPDYLKVLFKREDPKNNLTYQFAVPWIGQGLLLLDGEKWFQHRKMLTPGFHYSILRPYVKIMADSVNVMLDKWEKLTAQGETLELFQHVSLMTLDTLMKCSFNNSNYQKGSDSKTYIQAVKDLTSLLSERIHTFYQHNNIVYWLSSPGRCFRRACKIAHQHSDQVIEERKKTLQNVFDLEKIRTKRHLDFLDILLCAKTEEGKGLSDADLRAEVDTLMFEGHDTTASGISWTLYCLALHPEHQQRCREEAQKILGERDTIQWEDLAQLTFTTMFIKESMRLYPSVPSISRQLSSPITFFDGRSLPQGSSIRIHIYSLHRNPLVWKDPEELYRAAVRHERDQGCFGPDPAPLPARTRQIPAPGAHLTADPQVQNRHPSAPQKAALAPQILRPGLHQANPQEAPSTPNNQ